MFSDSDLLHIVFANENDTYYCSSMMKLDLNQYLWFMLHEKYKSVYFMEEDDGACSFYTYGDDPAAANIQNRNKSSIFGKKKKKLEWMLNDLEAPSSDAAAFVCPMNYFCKLFGDESREKLAAAFANSRKRSGIIVLTAPAETDLTRKLLTESPAFEYIKEPWVKAVRSEAPVRLFETIKSTKPISCLNLNYFTKERIRSVLYCVMMEDSSRFLPRDELDKVIDYLYQYLNGWTFRVYETTLPDNQLDYRIKYSDLYNYFSNNECRKKLLDRCAEIESMGGLRKYMDSVNCPFKEDTDELRGNNFYRAPNSYAESFIRYCSTAKFNSIAGDTEKERAETLKLITAIRKEIVHVRNGTENEKLAAKADAMITKLDTYKGYRDHKANIYTLKALNFIVSNITAPAGSEKEKDVIEIAELYDMYINVEINLFCSGEYDLMNSLQKKQYTLFTEQEQSFRTAIQEYLGTFKVKYPLVKAGIPAVTAEIKVPVPQAKPDENQESAEEANPDEAASDDTEDQDYDLDDFDWEGAGNIYN